MRWRAGRRRRRRRPVRRPRRSPDWSSFNSQALQSGAGLGRVVAGDRHVALTQPDDGGGEVGEADAGA
ncbi:hypothetical protein [Streptomyces exfoliatus]|uniref:hypothetical protein n=1 Tax=Streptomyces exfoliatus TaxID=1905 RepID=UPI0004B35580|nr:hypothetical protein [Streptomyces exfoliatus]